MAAITITDLSGEHPFGAAITGVDRDCLADEAVRQQLRDTLQTRGMILFDGIEPSDRMQVAVSEVFGPLQDHAIKGVARIDEDNAPGMIELGAEAGNATVYEVDGRPVAGKVDWHFDACYTDKLNRGGVLRLTTITPEEGMTGFADGVQLWNALSSEWQAKAERLHIIYHEALMFHRQHFGELSTLRQLNLQREAGQLIAAAEDRRRAVHPAVWQRASGEKVLHICPWQAVGIEGRLDETGNALFAALWAEVQSVMLPYRHKWRPDQMIIWDNWRFIHSVGGHDPKYSRNARRTTIEGDYGLGRLEGEQRQAGRSAKSAESR